MNGIRLLGVSLDPLGFLQVAGDRHVGTSAEDFLKIARRDFDGLGVGMEAFG
jgi:hypothetical protein